MQIEMIDYSKPPPGYTVGHESEAQWYWVNERRGDVALGRPAAVAAAWAHYKAASDPPGMDIWREGGGRDDARPWAWAWHDRRQALARDLADQLGEPGSATALLSKVITWTAAECEEVETYAALPFPRSVDMPAPLQRILLAEGSRTC
jgi:hypothetical protein